VNKSKKTMVIKMLVATFAISTTLSASAKSDEKSNSHNTLSTQGFEVCVMDVRATTYHKTEAGADGGTRRGLSSLSLKLSDAGPKTVGSIAIDPEVIPYGSLIIVTTKRGERNYFLCVDTGGDVKKRKASQVLAKKQKLGAEYAKRPVIDIYSTKSYNDWMSVVVIKDSSLRGLSVAKLRKRLKERMSADFWSTSQEIASKALQQTDASLLAQR
jgi:3D (Asp-Asp-Asp) domain-containing protein